MNTHPRASSSLEEVRSIPSFSKIGTNSRSSDKENGKKADGRGQPVLENASPENTHKTTSEDSDGGHAHTRPKVFSHKNAVSISQTITVASQHLPHCLKSNPHFICSLQMQRLTVAVSYTPMIPMSLAFWQWILLRARSLFSPALCLTLCCPQRTLWRHHLVATSLANRV